MGIVRRILSGSAFAGLFVLSVSCSDSRLSESNVFGETSTPRQLSFSDWCSEWKLNCEQSKTPMNLPFTLAQVKSGLRLSDRFLHGASRLQFSANDWNTADMLKAFDLISQSNLHEQVSKKFEVSGFVNALIDGSGSARINFSSSHVYAGPSGLQWLLPEQASISLGQEGNIEISGMTINSADGSHSLKVLGAKALDSQSYDLQTDELIVHSVPLWFFTQEAFDGIDDVTLKTVPAKNLAMGLNRLLATSLGSVQSVKIDQNFLSELGREYDTLVPKPKEPANWFEALRTVISRVNSVSFGAGSGKAVVAGQLQDAGSLFCSVSGVPIVIEIRKDFGVEIPVQKASDRVVISMRGIAAKLDLPGPFDPGFDLSTVEYTGEKMILKGVPVVGEYGIDPATFKDKKVDFQCK